jgi:hypothetical protein
MSDAIETIRPIGGPELEYLLLARLERFADLLADPVVRAIPACRRLAQHAASVALQDCTARGLADEARVILSEAGTRPRTGSAPR